MPIVLGMLAVGAVPLALWFFIVGGEQYAFDAEGIEKLRWRKATIPWSAMTEIPPALRQADHRQGPRRGLLRRGVEAGLRAQAALGLPQRPQRRAVPVPPAALGASRRPAWRNGIVGHRTMVSESSLSHRAGRRAVLAVAGGALAACATPNPAPKG